VINALRLTKQFGGVTIGLLGAEGGKIKDIVDAYVPAPGQNIEQEEDAHMILAHIITRHMRAVVLKMGSNLSVCRSFGPMLCSSAIVSHE
jgi:D-sedoheptulose 7-phosphate isomerase